MHVTILTNKNISDHTNTFFHDFCYILIITTNQTLTYGAKKQCKKLTKSSDNILIITPFSYLYNINTAQMNKIGVIVIICDALLHRPISIHSPSPSYLPSTECSSPTHL